MPRRLVRDILGTQKPLSVAPIVRVRDAARQMDARNVASILVIDAGERLLGIFTERDLLRRVVSAGRDPDKTAISDVMTSKPHTVGPDTSALQAMRVMQEHHIRHLPVVQGDHAIGVLSIRDFLGGELDEFKREQERREEIWDSFGRVGGNE